MTYVRAEGVLLLMYGSVQALISILGEHSVSKVFKSATQIGAAIMLLHADSIVTQIL